MSGAETYVRALLWVHKQQPYDPAELIVRLAKPSRWPSARFAEGDVDRAARAITQDRHYFDEVYDDAVRTINRAQVLGSQRPLTEALLAVRPPVSSREGEQ